MKKLYLIITILAIIPKIQAQQATTTSGGNANGTTGSVNYSVGQIVFISAIGATGSSSQGVQQPFEIVTLGTDYFPEIKLMMTVYPNPTTAFINLKIENHSLENVQYQLFDANGRQIKSQKITASETQISMENLAKAIYVLNVFENNKIIKAFKIIKN